MDINLLESEYEAVILQELAVFVNVPLQLGERDEGVPVKDCCSRQKQPRHRWPVPLHQAALLSDVVAVSVLVEQLQCEAAPGGPLELIVVLTWPGPHIYAHKATIYRHFKVDLVAMFVGVQVWSTAYLLVWFQFAEIVHRETDRRGAPLGNVVHPKMATYKLHLVAQPGDLPS